MPSEAEYSFLLSSLPHPPLLVLGCLPLSSPSEASFWLLERSQPTSFSKGPVFWALQGTEALLQLLTFAVAAQSSRVQKHDVNR